MIRFTATVFVNVGEHNWDGYTPTSPLATADDLILSVVADDALSAANRVFDIGNRMAVDTDGASWPSDVRSVSVGDLIKVVDGTTQTFLSVDSYGFTSYPEPTNRIVPLAGTRATSRQVEDVTV